MKQTIMVKPHSSRGIKLPQVISDITGFQPGDSLELQAEEGILVLTKAQMTEVDIVEAVGTLKNFAIYLLDYTENLLENYNQSWQESKDLSEGLCENCDYAEGEDDDYSLPIPLCAFCEAGIDPDEPLIIYNQENSIVIKADDGQDDTN